jgi:hypothetical protein
VTLPTTALAATPRWVGEAKVIRGARLQSRARMFWVLMASTWRAWRAALVIIQPDTVLRWHCE